jgi:hypothetical protein
MRALFAIRVRPSINAGSVTRPVTEFLLLHLLQLLLL